MSASMINKPMITIEHLNTRLGGQLVHRDLSCQIYSNRVTAIVGGSGSGKTTLLRQILMLSAPESGSIRVMGKEIAGADMTEAENIQFASNMGMLFQQAALFSAMTVLENIAFPFKEYTQFADGDIEQLARHKIDMVGLPLSSADKYPSELSGGMQKRAALARAIALDPAILFLDEPTAGLDPQSAHALDELVHTLKKALNLTVIVVTHDQDSIWSIVDEVVYIGQGKVLAQGPIAEVAQIKSPKEIYDYFNGARGRHNGVGA